jgi:hypothetical protein
MTLRLKSAKRKILLVTKKPLIRHGDTKKKLRVSVAAPLF